MERPAAESFGCPCLGVTPIWRFRVVPPSDRPAGLPGVLLRPSRRHLLFRLRRETDGMMERANSLDGAEADQLAHEVAGFVDLKGPGSGDCSTP